MPYEIKRTRCTCGVVLWDKRTPLEVHPGDFSVCMYCGQILLITTTFELTPIELKDVPIGERARTELMQREARMFGPWLRLALERRRKHSQ